MSNSPEKEKWWLYLILFIIGVLSLPLGLFSIVPLSGILTVLQNTLCGVGWCGIDLLWAAQFLFPFLICSILVSLVIYYFKERSFALALKVLVISFAIISLLFFGGLYFLNFIQLPIGAPTYYINIHRFDTVEEISETNPQLNRIESEVITAEELENYPVLKKAINEYDLTKNEYNSSWSKVEHDEWIRTKDFIEQKGRKPWYLFSIEDKELKEELDKMKIYTDSSIPAKLRKTFENNGISLSEDDRIFKLSENMVRTHGEMAYEIRNEEGKINVYHNRGDYGTAFKFGEKYYRIMFTHGD
ncbi:MAG TPA: hypothetical protein VN316_02285 [candidate division Zixibacteria bacterium]|nr:hypothetical protein [candidate division Zixibacteria bacterium]